MKKKVKKSQLLKWAVVDKKGNLIQQVGKRSEAREIKRVSEEAIGTARIVKLQIDKFIR